jgi:hypothetical protein
MWRESAVRNRRFRANLAATGCRAGATSRFTPPEPINCAGGVTTISLAGTEIIDDMMKPGGIAGSQRLSLRRPTSRDMVERFCDTRFERFDRREHSLLRVFHKLFGLLGYRLDLIACVLCRKFHQLGGRLHSVQPLHKVKRGVGVRVRELQKLVVEVLHTLKRGRRTGFDDIGCLGRRGAHVLESFSRLRGALFRHLTKCSRGVCFCGTSGSSCGPGHVHKALVLRAFSIDAGRDALSAGPMSLFANGVLISGAPTQ